ncbi:MAG: hypothetical protein JSV88_30270, partial [Candidatus Aminicenantes bacterium]
EIVSLLPGDQVEEPGENEENGDIDQPQSETSLPGPDILKLNIRQGVERLPLDIEKEIHLGALVLEPLKKKLTSKVNSSVEELLFTLAEKEVTLDTPVCSLNCHTIINVNVNVSNNSSENAPLRFQSTAQGEVTFTGEQVLQFGLSTVRFYPAGPGGTPWSFSHLTEHGIAHLPMGLDGLLKFPGSENIKVDTELLENLQVLVRVKEMETPGFKIISCLKWKGEITEEMISKFKEKKIILTWEALHAWKSFKKYNDK